MTSELDELIGRLRGRVDELGAPEDVGLPRRASAADLESVSTVLGLALPRPLRRALVEIADGGFGPGRGLLGTSDLVRVTGRCRRHGEGRDAWPTALLPVAELGEGTLACVATDDPAAPVLVFDPARLAEGGPLADALAPASPALVAWLDEWAAAPADHHAAPTAATG